MLSLMVNILVSNEYYECKMWLGFITCILVLFSVGSTKKKIMGVKLGQDTFGKLLVTELGLHAYFDSP